MSDRLLRTVIISSDPSPGWHETVRQGAGSKGDHGASYRTEDLRHLEAGPGLGAGGGQQRWVTLLSSVIHPAQLGPGSQLGLFTPRTFLVKTEY